MSHGHTSKVKDFTVNGATFEVQVDTSNGNFRASVDGEILVAPSLKGLQEKIRKHVKTARHIAIPVTLIDDYKPDDTKIAIRQITLTGLHGRSGKAVYKDDKSGRTDTLGYWGTLVRRLEGSEIQEFVDLVKAQWAAVRAVEEWVEERQINAHTVVTAEQDRLNALLPAPPEPAEETVEEEV